jgi:hypothetical protein
MSITEADPSWERCGEEPRFDIDERAMPIGTAMLAGTGMRFLRGSI